MVGDLSQQVSNTIEPRTLLVVSIHHVPRALLSVRVGEHLVLDSRVIHPVPSRLNVHGAELPTLDGIAHAFLKSPLLFLIVYGKPILL
jgi:hypothetical protein